MNILCISCGASFRLNPFLLKNFKGARVRCRRCGASIVAMNPLVPSIMSKRVNIGPSRASANANFPVAGPGDIGFTQPDNPTAKPMPFPEKSDLAFSTKALPLESRFQWWTDIALVLLVLLFAGTIGYLVALALTNFLKLG